MKFGKHELELSLLNNKPSIFEAGITWFNIGQSINTDQQKFYQHWIKIFFWFIDKKPV